MYVIYPVCVLDSLVDLLLLLPKETTSERADFTLQLQIFVTAEMEWQMFKIFFLSSLDQLLSPRFKARIG